MAFQGSLASSRCRTSSNWCRCPARPVVSRSAGRASRGEIYLRAGQIVHARVGDLEGEEAVYELAIWPEGEFTFHAGEESPRRHDPEVEHQPPDGGGAPHRRVAGAVEADPLHPAGAGVHRPGDDLGVADRLEWRLVCKIDERRTDRRHRASLGQGPFDTCKLLYGLVTSGLVALKEDLSSLGADRLQKMTPDELREVFEGIHRQASTLLANGDRGDDLDSAYRTSRSELDAGRGSEAVVDLVRAEEKLVSAALGPNQSKVFLDRVQRLLGGR
jgi:hypothetical protein